MSPTRFPFVSLFWILAHCVFPAAAQVGSSGLRSRGRVHGALRAMNMAVPWARMAQDKQAWVHAVDGIYLPPQGRQVAARLASASVGAAPPAEPSDLRCSCALCR